ncbi:MAG: hypothetical protein OXF83_08185 [Anaerolineaceae bacterium]|nr:hypothetical protein [Anaerolineaceae bacterium]
MRKRFFQRSGPGQALSPVFLPVISLALILSLLWMGSFWGEREPQAWHEMAPALPLTHQYLESPTAFAFSYPDGWQYHIPQTNVLIIAPPALFQLEPAPSIVVQRNLGLIGEGSLNAMMDAYLRRGPFAGNHAWQQVAPIAETMIAGRRALIVVLQGRDLAGVGSEELWSQIALTQAANRMVYIFVATVPLSQRTAYESTLAAVLSSVEIRE